MYFLRLFGNVTLESAAGPLSSRVVPRRRMALLALLGAEGSAGLSREKLVGLLWPERSDQSARHLLADTVYRLRKALGDAVVTSDGETLRVDDTLLRVDTQDFSEAVAAEDLESAVSLYRGPFMDGFHLPGSSEEFERWLDAERSRFSLEAEKAIESLALRAEAGGDPVRAVEWWRQLITRDPINSRVALHLMHALTVAGDRANAVEFGRRHERLVRDELGIEPPAELGAFLETLQTPGDSPRHAAPQPEAPPATGLPPASSRWDRPFHGRRPSVPVQPLPLPFVSREPELEKLKHLLKETLAGRGGLGWVTGEAGTGKTALVEEFCRRGMEGRGDLVVATGNGRAYTGAGDPYLVFRDVLGLLTGDVEARWAAGSISSGHARRLWNLLPTTVSALVTVGGDLVGTFVPTGDLLERVSAHEAGDAPWRDAFTNLVASREASPEPSPSQAALFRQYTRVLRAVARERPLLLVLDDLQWVDAGSIDLLFHMAGELGGSRILILGLYRPSEVALGRNDARHPLEPVVHELVRRSGAIEVPLGEGESRAFLDAVLGAMPSRFDAAFSDTLFGHTRGHALFTVELLRGMQEKGVLVRDDSGHWTRSGEVDWGALPPRVEAVIAEGIGRLPRDALRALTVASVEGERFTLEVVASALGCTKEDLGRIVGEELVRRHHLVCAHGVRRAEAWELSEYTFRHILYQRYLYDRLDPVERTHLHARIGEAVESLYGQRSEEVALPLARHFEEAGLNEKAAAYLHQAGGRALSAAAHVEAVGHLRRAVELMRTLPRSPERDHSELEMQMALGSIWYGVEDHGVSEAQGALERARELSERLGDRTQRFWISAGFAAICHYRARQDEARGFLEECLGLADAEDAAALKAMSHAWFGVNASNRGRHGEALAHYDRFRALYDPDGHAALLSAWMDNPDLYIEGETGLVLWLVGRPDAARARIERACRAGEERGRAVVLHLLLLQEVVVLMWLRELSAMDRQAERLGSLGIEHGMPQIVTWARFMKGWCIFQKGHRERGVAVMEEGLAELDHQQWAVWRPFHAALLAEALAKTGRAEEGLDSVGAGLAEVEATGERIHEPEQHRIRGELLLGLQQPDPAGAEASFRRAMDVARAQEARSYELRAATSLARLLRGMGRAEEADELLSPVYGGFAEGLDTADLLAARSLLDSIREGRGRT